MKNKELEKKIQKYIYPVTMACIVILVVLIIVVSMMEF